MARSPQRARLEYHRSHLLYYRKHCGRGQQVALRALLTARAALALAAAVISGDRSRRDEPSALLRLALTRPTA
jgi:hypothetical protein